MPDRGWADFFGSEFAIAVAVQLEQPPTGRIDFVGRDLWVVVVVAVDPGEEGGG